MTNERRLFGVVVILLHTHVGLQNVGVFVTLRRTRVGLLNCRPQAVVQFEQTPPGTPHSANNHPESKPLCMGDYNGSHLRQQCSGTLCRVVVVVVR